MADAGDMHEDQRDGDAHVGRIERAADITMTALGVFSAAALGNKLVQTQVPTLHKGANGALRFVLASYAAPAYAAEAVVGDRSLVIVLLGAVSAFCGLILLVRLVSSRALAAPLRSELTRRGANDACTLSLPGTLTVASRSVRHCRAVPPKRRSTASMA